jgi:hypothetical protein
MRLGSHLLGGALLLVVAGSEVEAQHPALVRAQRAYEELDFATAIREAQLALEDRPGQLDQIAAYELLGFAYGAMDSARQATAAFRQLVFLDPDREPDPFVISPRITSLYAAALGQVLVLRHVRLDSATFVADSGAAMLRFAVSRPARVVMRVVGERVAMVVNTQMVSAEGTVAWDARGPDGMPLPPGGYQLVLDAAEGPNEYSRALHVTVVHGPVDTLSHVTALPGFEEQPEYEVPPRTWSPLGRATFYTAMASAPALLLESTLDAGAKREVFLVSGAILLTGVVASLRKPERRPIRAAVLYNNLLRQQIAERNLAIAAENAARRRLVKLSVFPSREPPL